MYPSKIPKSIRSPWPQINRKLFILIRIVHSGPFVASFWPIQNWYLNLFLQKVSDHAESWHT